MGERISLSLRGCSKSCYLTSHGTPSFFRPFTLTGPLCLVFSRWVNRKDAGGHNVFEGGFLGLDNIGAFNRSEPLPTGGTLRQADGTAWMAFYCLNMLSIALELAKHNPVYEDIASKFFEVSLVIELRNDVEVEFLLPIALHLHRRCDDLSRRCT